ncbi:MAG: GNAT family N-acetyltransferase [Hyphomicrobiaceae bacterium]
MADIIPDDAWIAGPHPGWLGDTAALNGRYYAEAWGFPLQFECKVAREMADFALRYDPARDLALTVRADGRGLATLTLDGSDGALAPGQAHLRWFIVDAALRGRGCGQALMGRVIGFARATGYSSVYLTTFRGLDAAAALYTRAGFAVTDESEGATWGRTVVEQRLELRLV